jgi:hypothetical protein
MDGVPAGYESDDDDAFSVDMNNFDGHVRTFSSIA